MEHGTQNILNFLLKKMFPITSRASDPSCKIISVLVSASGCFDVWYVWFLNIWKFFRHRNFSQLLKRSEMEKKKNTSLAEWWCWLSDGETWWLMRPRTQTNTPLSTSTPGFKKITIEIKYLLRVFKTVVLNLSYSMLPKMYYIRYRCN